MHQLRRDRVAKPWPLPLGYQRRITAAYLAQVYRNVTSALEYGRELTRKHRLEHLAPAQEILTILEAVGFSILHDGRYIINVVAVETLLRRACGLEKAFDEFWLENYDHRPEGRTGKSRTSKLKQDLYDRYDVRNWNLKGTRLAKADEVAEESMEGDAAFYECCSKATANMPPRAEA